MFVTKDLRTIVCKQLNASDFEVEYSLEVKSLYNTAKGYPDTKYSPFIESTGFYDRKPSKGNCFTLIGPMDRHGRQKLNVICESALEAHKWIEYVELLRKRKKMKKEKKKLGQTMFNEKI